MRPPPRPPTQIYLCFFQIHLHPADGSHWAGQSAGEYYAAQTPWEWRPTQDEAERGRGEWKATLPGH